MFFWQSENRNHRFIQQWLPWAEQQTVCVFGGGGLKHFATWCVAKSGCVAMLCALLGCGKIPVSVKPLVAVYLCCNESKKISARLLLVCSFWKQLTAASHCMFVEQTWRRGRTTGFESRRWRWTARVRWLGGCMPPRTTMTWTVSGPSLCGQAFLFWSLIRYVIGEWSALPKTLKSVIKE